MTNIEKKTTANSVQTKAAGSVLIWKFVFLLYICNRFAVQRFGFAAFVCTQIVMGNSLGDFYDS
jgi:hypothetical protein